MTSPSTLTKPDPACWDCGAPIAEKADGAFPFCAADWRKRKGIARTLALIDVARRAIVAGIPPRALLDTTAAKKPSSKQLAAREHLEALMDGATSKPWVYVYGPVGTGKSTEAARAVFRGIARRRVAHPAFVNASDLVEEVLATYNGRGNRQAVIDRYANAPLLVLDDLGNKRATQHSADLVLEVLDARYRRCAPTIIISNHRLDDLASHLANVANAKADEIDSAKTQAKRIVDRINELSVRLLIDGDSHRVKGSGETAAQWRIVSTIDARLRDGSPHPSAPEIVQIGRTFEEWESRVADLVAELLPEGVSTLRVEQPASEAERLYQLMARGSRPVAIHKAD